MNTPQEIVLGIVVRHGRVLMIRRNKSDGVVWSFPGGKIEIGESIFSACEREMFEEVGLMCRPERELGSRWHPDTSRLVHYVLCDSATGAAWNREVDKATAVSWFTLDEVESNIATDLFPPVRMAIVTADPLPMLAASVAR